MKRPILLLSNDDGIHAAGLRELARQLGDLGDVLVVAPDRERSATSHAFTLDRPLRCDEIEPGWFAVDGTPADCVYIGLLKLCPSQFGARPSLVISGINHGFNLGSDVFYSGTVAGAVEAALRDVPALAISREWQRGAHREPASYEPAARFAHALARAVLAEGLPPGTLLNVNAPASWRGGYRWARLGKRIYRDQVDERRDLRGRRYYWIGGAADGFGDVADSDLHAVRDGLVAVTPLDLDLTHAGLLERLPGWRLEGFDQVVARDLAAPPLQGEP